MWLISDVPVENDLEAFIKHWVSQESAIDFPSNMQCTGVFYKIGKLILTFGNNVKNQQNLIVVIALSNNAIFQRDNEYLAIEKLAEVPELRKYLTSRVQKYVFAGFCCYIMQQTEGVTVDIPNKSLSLMTNNANDVIIELAKYTRSERTKREDFVKLIQGYIANIVKRIPSSSKQMASIENYLTISLESTNFSSVCLHGDSKLENFVLSKEFDVVGIIDWELCELKSFPLLDLIYMITYNYQTTYGVEFNNIFRRIWESKLDSFNAGLIDNYCSQMRITMEEKKLLLIVFFIHHYGKRFLLREDRKQALRLFKSSITMLIKFIAGK